MRCQSSLIDHTYSNEKTPLQGIIGCECEHPKREDTDLNSSNIEVTLTKNKQLKGIKSFRHKRHLKSGAARRAVVTANIPVVNVGAAPRQHPTKLWGHEEESTVKRKDKIADLEHAVKAKVSNKEVNVIMIDKEKKTVHMDHDNYDRHRHAVEIVEETPLHHWFNDSLEDNMEIQVNSYHH
ncbi:hypothetical protein Tco_1531763 [Tanacetum coccineum]